MPTSQSIIIYTTSSFDVKWLHFVKTDQTTPSLPLSLSFSLSLSLSLSLFLSLSPYIVLSSFNLIILPILLG